MATRAISDEAAPSPAPPAGPLWSAREWWLAVGLCLVTSFLRLAWPGDTGWINDEPLFLSKAAAMTPTISLAASAMMS